MYTDTEMLDWLSTQQHINWRENTDNDDLTFFSCPSQHITAPNLREAISRAMQIQLRGILTGNENLARLELDPDFPRQSYHPHFHAHP